MTTTRAATRMTPAQLADAAGDLRLACMRISRRVRFENTGDVAPHQFSVLARLSETDRMTPGELADAERVSAPSMTRTVNALVERGLVERGGCAQDGRQVRLTLTAAGRALLRATRRRRDEWMIARLSRLDPDEQDLLRRAAAVLARVAAE